MREPASEFVTFRATASQKEAIERAAQSERRSVSSWCLMQIEPVLDEQPEPKPEPRGHRSPTEDRS